MLWNGAIFHALISQSDSCAPLSRELLPSAHRPTRTKLTLFHRRRSFGGKYPCLDRAGTRRHSGQTHLLRRAHSGPWRGEKKSGEAHEGERRQERSRGGRKRLLLSHDTEFLSRRPHGAAKSVPDIINRFFLSRRALFSPAESVARRERSHRVTRVISRNDAGRTIGAISLDDSKRNRTVSDDTFESPSRTAAQSPLRGGATRLRAKY